VFHRVLCHEAVGKWLGASRTEQLPPRPVQDRASTLIGRSVYELGHACGNTVRAGVRRRKNDQRFNGLVVCVVPVTTTLLEQEPSLNAELRCYLSSFQDITVMAHVSRWCIGSALLRAEAQWHSSGCACRLNRSAALAVLPSPCGQDTQESRLSRYAMYSQSIWPSSLEHAASRELRQPESMSTLCASFDPEPKQGHEAGKQAAPFIPPSIVKLIKVIMRHGQKDIARKMVFHASHALYNMTRKPNPRPELQQRDRKFVKL
jgi:hypothetical protein